MSSWLKLWLEPNLDGPVRTDLTPAERGAYYDLQLLAKKCDQGGYLASENGKPYSLRWIAARLNINYRLLSTVLQKCNTIGLITNTQRGVYLQHFLESQSDYYRQKPYRLARAQNTDPDKYIKGKYGHMVQR